MTLNLDTRLRLRADRVTWKRQGDEVIALELDGQEYLAARDSGAELWQRLTEPVTGADLAAWITDHYGIEAERAREDVTAFLQQLSERGLLEPA
jgi:hypothetical protein